MRGNLADLVATGIASEPTLRKWITAEPDQAWILKRGSNGDAYEIDIPGAVEAFRAAEEAKAQAVRDRAAAVRQLALELGIGSDQDEQSEVSLSILERRQLLEEEFVAIKLSEKRRQLVRFAEAQAAWGDVLVKFAQLGRTFAARVAKRIDLSRAQITEIDRMVERDLRELADMMEKMEVEVGNGGDGAGAGEDPAA